MDELMEFIIPAGKDFSLVDQYEYTYWKLRAKRAFVIDWELGDDYRCIELAKTLIQMNLDEMDTPEDSLRPVTIYIHSFGGDLDQAMALCDVIEASRIPIITVCLGVAMSAGFLIFLAGHRRYAMKQNQLLVHSGSASFSGTAEQISSAQENYKKTLDKMRGYILEHTTIDKKLFDKNRNKDWYISGKEDIEKLGIAKVISSLSEIV